MKPLVVASFCSWEEGFSSQELSGENYSQAVEFTPKENKRKTEDISSGFSNARHQKVRKIYRHFSPSRCLQDLNSFLTFFVEREILFQDNEIYGLVKKRVSYVTSWHFMTKILTSFVRRYGSFFFLIHVSFLIYVSHSNSKHFAVSKAPSCCQ